MQTSPQRTTLVPNTSTANRGDIRRNGDPLANPQLGHRGCQTLYEAFRRGQALNPLGPCLGFRAVSTNGQATPYIYSSYTEVLARVDSFAAGLDSLGLVPPTSDNMTLIGLYMKNSPEWFIAEHGIFALSGATVPFYDTLGPDTVEYILGQTDTKTVVSTRDELERLCQVKKSGKCPNFEYVVLADGVTPEAAALAEESGVKVMSFAKVEAVGAQLIATKGHQHRPPNPDDIFTFCYTSGTTGNPKGALLTHSNLISVAAGGDAVFQIQVSDRHLSYLPMAHIFERIVICQTYSAGASIAFFRGDTLLILEDIQACRPTVFPSVPRMLNKIYDKIVVGVTEAGGFKKKLFDAAVATKTKNLLATGELKHALYDRLLFNKVKAALGLDQLRIMVSGSAPLSTKVMSFFRIMTGVPIVEGYGQTEGAGCSTVGTIDDMSTVGHVGVPNSAADIVLVDVPEMGYFHTDADHKGQPCQGRGEIWMRGPHIFKGYYKEPEKTRETLTEDGWLMTGDIGLWTEEGCLQIIDRKKNIFKLAQGEYIAPEKIENVIIQSLLVAQAFVYGDSLQSSLVAVLVPDEEAVRSMVASSDDAALSKASFAEICQSDKFKKLVFEEMMRAGKQNGLLSYEIPKAIHLASEVFSVDNELLTPTFKLKRAQARERYAREIEEMYATIPPPKSNL